MQNITTTTKTIARKYNNNLQQTQWPQWQQWQWYFWKQAANPQKLLLLCVNFALSKQKRNENLLCCVATKTVQNENKNWSNKNKNKNNKYSLYKLQYGNTCANKPSKHYSSKLTSKLLNHKSNSNNKNDNNCTENTSSKWHSARRRWINKREQRKYENYL